MLELEVLIGELGTVDRLPTGAVSSSEVTALNHEVLDHAVERRAFISEALLTCGKSTEVLCGLSGFLAYCCIVVVSELTSGTVLP